MTRLKGKVALVTGAQQGIGEAAAVALGAEGAHVVVNWLDDADAAKRIVQPIAQSGSQASLVQGDVSESTAIERLLTETQQLGGIDVLVNNAGMLWDGMLHTMQDDQWQKVLDVHATAPSIVQPPRSTCSTPGISSAWMSKASTRMRKARPYSATIRPRRPQPTIPRVLPDNWCGAANGSAGPIHPRLARSKSRGRRRTAASSRAHAPSAVAVNPSSSSYSFAWSRS